MMIYPQKCVKADDRERGSADWLLKISANQSKTRKKRKLPTHKKWIVILKGASERTMHVFFHHIDEE